MGQEDIEAQPRLVIPYYEVLCIRIFFHLKMSFKKSPCIPLWQRGKIPLFGKEGLGEIFITLCDGCRHVCFIIIGNIAKNTLLPLLQEAD